MANHVDMFRHRANAKRLSRKAKPRPFTSLPFPLPGPVLQDEEDEDVDVAAAMTCPATTITMHESEKLLVNRFQAGPRGEGRQEMTKRPRPRRRRTERTTATVHLQGSRLGCPDHSLQNKTRMLSMKPRKVPARAVTRKRKQSYTTRFNRSSRGLLTA